MWLSMTPSRVSRDVSAESTPSIRNFLPTLVNMRQRELETHLEYLYLFPVLKQLQDEAGDFVEDIIQKL